MKLSAFTNALLPVILLTSACATTVRPENSIELDARSLIHNVDGKVYIPQSEILVDIKVSNAASNAGMAAAAVPGLGVLLAGAVGGAGAAIDAKVNAERQKSAEKAIDPIKDKLVGYDFANVVHKKITSEVAK